MKLVFLSGALLFLLAGCAPQLRFTNAATQSLSDLGYSNAQAKVGFWSWDLRRIKNGQYTEYRFLDSDGVGGWISTVQLDLRGPATTNRIFNFQAAFGSPALPFKRYTWDLFSGASNGTVRED